MKQIQMFAGTTIRELQKQVNQFIHDIGPLGIVHDIKYNTGFVSKKGRIAEFAREYSAMVIFSFEEITA
jgi:hypothetical protein